MTTKRVEKALRAAMERLLAGRPRRSDGDLTIPSWAIEANVGKATIYRAKSLLDEFQGAVDRRGNQAEGSLKEQNAALKKQIKALRSEHHREMVQMRASLNVLAQKIQILTLENEKLRAPSGSSKVTALPARS